MAGIEQNPGPKKGRRRLTARTDKMKNHDKYVQQKQAKDSEELLAVKSNSTQRKHDCRNAMDTVDKQYNMEIDHGRRSCRRSQIDYRDKEKIADVLSKRSLRSNREFRNRGIPCQVYTLPTTIPHFLPICWSFIHLGEKTQNTNF